MTSYQRCAGSPVAVASVADTTGRNAGNLTAAFTTGVLGTMPAVYEWFRGVVSGPVPAQQPPPAVATIYLNNDIISATYPVGVSAFSPAQPVPMRDGDELYFFWALASSTAVKPVVTLMFRFDADLPANQGYRG